MLYIVSCLAALLKELDCSQEVPQLCQCVLSYNFVHFTSFLSKVFGCDVLSAQAYCFVWFCERVVHHFVAQIEQQCGSWTWQCFPSTRRCPVWCARVWHTVCPCVAHCVPCGHSPRPLSLPPHMLLLLLLLDTVCSPHHHCHLAIKDKQRIVLFSFNCLSFDRPCHDLLCTYVASMRLMVRTHLVKPSFLAKDQGYSCLGLDIIVM